MYSNIAIVEIDFTQDPSEEPDGCTRITCDGELSRETSGPFTDWLQCEDCGLWIPQE